MHRIQTGGVEGMSLRSKDDKPTVLVPANFTQLLTDWRSGHPQALERLTPLVYEELRRLARGFMRGERGGHTLQATAVVHEAFLRLVHANAPMQDRTHFLALACRLMRRVLVDHAKARARLKRDSGTRETLSDEIEISPDPAVDMVALDEALESLALLEPQLAQVIELHYFGGLTYEQLAATLNSSTATVHRNIRLARAWLLNEIGSSRFA